MTIKSDSAAPNLSVIGDEWWNPSTGKFYKLLPDTTGIPSWSELLALTSTSSNARVLEADQVLVGSASSALKSSTLVTYPYNTPIGLVLTEKGTRLTYTDAGGGILYNEQSGANIALRAINFGSMNPNILLYGASSAAAPYMSFSNTLGQNTITGIDSNGALTIKASVYGSYLALDSATTVIGQYNNTSFPQYYVGYVVAPSPANIADTVGNNLNLSGGYSTGTGEGGGVRLFTGTTSVTSGTTSNTTRQMVAGVIGTDFIIGKEDLNTNNNSPAQVGYLRAPNVKNPSASSDIPGIDLLISSGLGSGAGANSNIRFYTNVVGASSTTRQTRKEVFQVRGDGYIRILSTSTGYSQFLHGANTFQASYTLPTAYATANGQALLSTTTGTLSWGAVAGTLTDITSTSNNTAPNATTPVKILAATDATAANADITILTKGQGAFQLNTPDSTATGGNKRGQYAVDLQMQRTGATMVASGTQSALIAGGSNTASGTNSVVVGGGSNVASGNGAIVVGGVGHNIASGSAVGGNYSTINVNASNALALGGNSMTITANATNYNTVIGGDSSKADAPYALVMMGQLALADTQYKYVQGGTYSGSIGVFGACQFGRTLLIANSTSTTAVRLTADRGAAGATNVANLVQTYTAHTFTIGIIALRQTTNLAAYWQYQGYIAKGPDNASTTVVANLITSNTTALSGVSVTITSDATNGGLNITAVGLTGVSIRWVASVQTTEVRYP